MGTKELFLPQMPERQRSSHVRLTEELNEDIALFSGDERDIVEKKLRGGGLSSTESPVFESAVGKWWQEKYGFPFRLKSAREEVLMRKYAPPEELREAYEIQDELFKAAEANNEKEMAELKKRYEAEYPDQLEGVEVLFGLRESLLKQQKMNEEKKIGDYRIEKGRFQDLTEYQFLFTHFIVQNSRDKQFLSRFWDTARMISQKARTLKELNGLRLGLLSQVAVYKIIEALGGKPKLSHPEQDAFHAIDLWAKNDVALQVKAAQAVEKPEVLESDHLSFPALQTRYQNEARYYNAKYFDDSVRFRAKIERYGRMIGKSLKGYLLIIPYAKIDFVTGEPAPELVDFFREKIGVEKQPVPRPESNK